MDVGVIGASGYIGGETVRLLLSHPKVNLNYVTSRRLVSKYFHSIYPNFRKISDLKFEEYSVARAKEKCDVIFLTVPHGISQDIVPDLLEAGLKVIDLSADFRLKDKEIYQYYYKKEHSHPELLVEKVRGYINSLNKRRINILEIGTGCGNIAISLTKNVTGCRIIASDISFMLFRLSMLYFLIQV